MPSLDEKTIAGLRCSEVLARLSDFIDGELEADVRRRVVEHVQGCTWCEEFGGRFSSIVQRLRQLSEDEVMDDEVARRLRDRLDREIR